MKICAIFNPNSGTAAAAGPVRAALERRAGVTIWTPARSAEVQGRVRAALREGVDLLIAAGGDGTVHRVVNALAPDFDRVRLGILPLGTGNDLRRTFAIPDDPEAALEVLLCGEERRVDLIWVETVSDGVYCCNVAAGGFSGQMQEALDDEVKSRWGPLAYVRGAAQVLPDLTDYRTRLTLDDGPPERVACLNVIVANGRTAGGGLPVASRANPEDGLLDVVVVRQGSLLEYAAVAARLLAGDYFDSDLVTHRRAQRVQVDSEPGMWFSVDGELWTKEPVTFTVVPRALRVVVGPAYVAEPVGA